MNITGTTKIIGIFGDPVAHTLSPVVQNAAFASLGLDFVYLPFHVRPAQLKEAVEGVRAFHMAGVNITIPHKVEVMRYLDTVEPHARDIGAVNTVVNIDGRLVGHNTDGAGFLKSLMEETGFTPRGARVLVVGAGGAARAVLYSILSEHPASVIILNRTHEKATALVKEFGARFPQTDLRGGGHSVPGGLADMEKAAASVDLVVNATSLGMEGNPELEFPIDALPTRAIVSDIVYSPLETGLLKRARARGLAVHNGLSMLIGQGAIGFELWTGVPAPVEVMKEAALKALGIT
jgi:shikimate dehydrogenase